MRRLVPFFLATLAVLAVEVSCMVNDQVVRRIVEPTVTVISGNAQGTGVVFVHNQEGFVLTAAHVVRNSVYKEEKKVKTRDVLVQKIVFEDGEEVGTFTLRATILVFDEDEDVALLKMRSKTRLWTEGAIIPPAERLTPKVGDFVFHCGSLGGTDLAPESLTFGVVSAVGRVIGGIGKGKVFDQTTATAIPGSSGGGVFLKETAEYIGMITLGSGETISLFVPIRRTLKVLGDWGYAHVLGRPDLNAPKPKTLQDIPLSDKPEEDEVYQRPIKKIFVGGVEN